MNEQDTRWCASTVITPFPSRHKFVCKPSQLYALFSVIQVIEEVVKVSEGDMRKVNIRHTPVNMNPLTPMAWRYTVNSKESFWLFQRNRFLDPRTTPSRESFWLILGWHLWSHFNPLNRVVLTTRGVISKWLLKELECKITHQKCRFTPIWSHFESSLASKCDFEPTSEWKRLLNDVETTH